MGEEGAVSRLREQPKRRHLNRLLKHTLAGFPAFDNDKALTHPLVDSPAILLKSGLQNVNETSVGMPTRQYKKEVLKKS